MTRLRAHTLGDAFERPDGVDENAVVTALRVPPESQGMRLDRFVQSQLKRTSRTRAQRIVDVSAFSPEGKALRSSDRVRAEQLVMLWRAPWDEEEVDTPLTILERDDALLAVDKPPFVPVHPTARYYRSTVVKRLEAMFPEARHYLAHRLDKDTSGVLLISLTSEADRHVKKQFAGLDPATGKPSARRFVEKSYLAIARGWPEEDRYRVDLPLEEDSASRLRVKMRVAKPGLGLVARTTCEVRGRRLRRETGERYCLVACGLETGRQHQIRVHLAATGTPLVGDKLYGGDAERHARGVDGTLTDADRAALELPRQALHAHTLELDHPSTGARVRFESALPKDLADFWGALDEP
ncbi:MAG TPA: RluA family pseudouridine synthase [Polyangiaceae bacterium]|nr:RluA family pseudouridine synthase [Polyangiaceae bacterium]